MTAPSRAGGAAPALPLQSPLAIRILGGVVLFGLWEIGVRLFAAPFVARPSGIIAALPSVLVDPDYWSASASTLSAVLIGLAIALVLGTLIGLMLGRIKGADRALSFWVSSFYAMPMIAALPLLTVWFGFDSGARLATIVFAAIFSIIINTADGARSVPREYVEVARSFRSARLRMLIDIVMPASLPYFLAGLRLAAGRALIGAVVAEFFTAIGGLGYYILYNSRIFKHDEAFVGVLLLAAFGVGCEVLVGWGTARFLPWYRRDEKTS